MSALLLTFAYFILGVIAGFVVAFVAWKYYQAPLLANAFKKMLAEQGYTIKDKRIVPMDADSQTNVKPAESDIDKQVREILEEGSV